MYGANFTIKSTLRGKGREMNPVKRFLVKVYNSLYDKKMDFELFLRWRKDIWVQNNYGLPKVMSIDQTLDLIIQEKVSICRYGDGEFKLMDGDRILFQKDSQHLTNRLKEVIASEDENILVCIPSFLDRRHPIFRKKTNKTNKAERKREVAATKYMDNIVATKRLQWYAYFDMERLYGDSLISRFYAEVYDDEKSDRWIKKWKQIWSGRKLLIVEGEKTRLGVGNDLFDDAIGIRRILAPATCAFSVYDSILQTVKSAYQEGELVLAALGPTATVLVYDLAKCGIQTLDIGHIDIEYEWFLRKDRTHPKIEGKYVSEAQGGQDVDDVINEQYHAEIITVL